MAYKQLLDNYAKQLNDKNQRVYELELQLVDRDHQIESLLDASKRQSAPSAANSEDAKQLNELIQEHATVSERLSSDFKARETLLSNQIDTLSQNLQESETARYSLDAHVQHLRKLQEAGEGRVGVLVDKIQELESKIGVRDHMIKALQSKTEQTIIRSGPGPSDGEDAIATTSNTPTTAGLQEVNRSLQRQLASKGNQLSTQQKLLNSALDRISSLTAATPVVTSRWQNYSLPVVFLEDLGLADEQYSELRRRRKRGGEDPGLARLRNEFANLKGKLYLERKRRSEAEAMLGPDGKRCRKCHPIVVEVIEDDGDDDSEEVDVKVAGS